MNDQKAYPDLSHAIPTINSCLSHVRSILGYPSYDVVLALVDDPEIQELNRDYLGKDRPTDILSFPFDDEVMLAPGVLGPPEFADIEDYYSLGDMIISVPYVMRRINEDMMLEPDGTSTIEEEEERGVSGIMATMDTVEQRIQALIVHGMLHLVGYDHIDDGDYELMVTKEEEVWKELQLRLHNDSNEDKSN